MSSVPSSFHKKSVSESLSSNLVSLNQSLQNRCSVEELESKGILKPGGKLAAQRVSLTKELISNALNRALESRPTLENVASVGIVESLDWLFSFYSNRCGSCIIVAGRSKDVGETDDS